LNQIPGWSGNGKRRKSTAVVPQSCKSEAGDTANIPIVPMGSGTFTDDDLTPGVTLLLSAIKVEQAFPYERTSEERRAAATRLAAWYRCSLAVCGPGENQILFSRHDDLEIANFR
jgi:hypothetical protein